MAAISRESRGCLEDLLELPVVVGDDVRVRAHRGRDVLMSDEQRDLRERESPFLCRIETRRCRSSFGLKTGTPASRQARLIRIRSLSAGLAPVNNTISPWRSSRGGSCPSKCVQSGSGIVTRRETAVFAMSSQTIHPLRLVEVGDGRRGQLAGRQPVASMT
jgi:hypothetical protein